MQLIITCYRNRRTLWSVMRYKILHLTSKKIRPSKTAAGSSSSASSTSQDGLARRKHYNYGARERAAQPGKAAGELCACLALNLWSSLNWNQQASHSQHVLRSFGRQGRNEMEAQAKEMKQIWRNNFASSALSEIIDQHSNFTGAKRSTYFKILLIKTRFND